MKRTTYFLLVLGLVALLTAGARASASVPDETASEPVLILNTMLRDPVPFDRAVKAAELIVVGTVSEIGDPVSGPPDEDGNPVVWTPVELMVERSLKAAANKGESVRFVQLGGTRKGLTTLFSGQTTFVRGERVLLFLYKPTGLFVQWTGGNLYADEGKYTIGADGWAHNALRAEDIALEALVTAISAALGTR